MRDRPATTNRKNCAVCLRRAALDQQITGGTSHAHSDLRAREAYLSLELKQVEHFEDDDDNDNDSDDVEDVSVHASWITRRYPRRQAIWSRNEKLESESLSCTRVQ